MSCDATAAGAGFGYGEIASLTTMYLTGNPLRIPMPVGLRWRAAATAGDRVRYTADLTVDLDTVVGTYLEETARPAVGLGGHLDLVDTVWMRLLARDVAISWPAPPGTSVSDATASGDGDPEVSTDTRGVTVRLASFDVSARTPGSPRHVIVSWTADTAGLPAGPLDLGPPTMTLDLEARLGVVAFGADVFGGTRLPMGCHAVGTVPVARTALSAAPPATTTSTTPPPPPARAVAATATFTG
jgi:hypothetical protein